MQVDPARVIDDLRELDRLTGGPDGARRLCWSDAWVQARSFLRERLAAIDGISVDEDEAGNLWATLPGLGQDNDDKKRAVPRLAVRRPRGRGGGRLTPGLRAERRLAGRSARGDGGSGGAAGGRRGPARARADSGRLRRRGGRALWPQPVRQLGGRRNARRQRARAAARRRRAGAAGRAGGTWRGPRPGRRGDLAAGRPDRLPGAAHRAGARARAGGCAGGGGERHVRGRAPPAAVRGTGLPRRHHADADAPGRGSGGGGDRTGGRGDRSPARRRGHRRRPAARSPACRPRWRAGPSS